MKLKNILLAVIFLGITSSVFAQTWYLTNLDFGMPTLNYTGTAGLWDDGAGNYRVGLPPAGANLVITAATLNLNSPGLSFTNVEVLSDGELDIPAGITLTVTNDITVNGTFRCDGAVICGNNFVMNGTPNTFFTPGTTLQVDGDLTVVSGATVNLTGSTVDVGGTFTVTDDGSVVTIIDADFPGAEPTGCIACLIGEIPAVPVPMWAIFGAFGLIGLFVIYSYKRKNAIA